MSDAYAGYEAYLNYLASLRQTGTEYFLEGGQAVNFWAEYVDSRIQDRPLSQMRPFTSKDCDIWISNETWKTLKRNPSVINGKSPADGQLGILTLSKQPPRVIDFLFSVYGIPESQYAKLLKRSLDDGIIRVIDPIYLFFSKCHCLTHLPQADRQDERHVRMLTMILPEYLSLLVADAENGTLSDRYLHKEIKLLEKIMDTGVCKRVMEKLKIERKSLIPWTRLELSTSTLLAKYSSSQSGSA